MAGLQTEDGRCPIQMREWNYFADAGLPGFDDGAVVEKKRGMGILAAGLPADEEADRAFALVESDSHKNLTQRRKGAEAQFFTEGNEVNEGAEERRKIQTGKVRLVRGATIFSTVPPGLVRIATVTRR
jgi:hypothetical protein